MLSPKGTLWRNWKTTITGLLTGLMGVSVFVNAIIDWSKHHPVDWRQVLVATSLSLIGAGLTSAKDATTHSTLNEVQGTTAKVALDTQVAEAIDHNQTVVTKVTTKPEGGQK